MNKNGTVDGLKLPVISQHISTGACNERLNFTSKSLYGFEFNMEFDKNINCKQSEYSYMNVTLFSPKYQTSPIFSAAGQTSLAWENKNFLGSMECGSNFPFKP